MLGRAHRDPRRERRDRLVADVLVDEVAGLPEGSGVDAGLATQAVSAIRAGDAIMVKGSLGSKMKTVVNALEKRFPGKAAHDEAAV